jgi:hypothetical protein
MRKALGMRSLKVAVLATALSMGLWQGVALAGDQDPSQPPTAPQPEPPAPEAPPADEASSAPATAPQTTTLQPLEGHDIEEPSGSPHATAQVADVNITDQDVVDAGSSHSQINSTESDDTSSDVTTLALFGEEVVGAHADSTGTTEDEAGAQILCEESEGQLCAGLLFARAVATEDADSAEAHGDSALVFVCVGGDNPDPTNSEECGDAALLAIGAAQSSSDIQKDKNTGESSADAESSTADACVGGQDIVTGQCSGVGARLIESESHSSISDDNGNRTTEDDTGTTERSSTVVGLEAGGEDAVVIPPSEPMDLSIPPGCPDDPGALICLFVNDGVSTTFVGGAGSRQEAVHFEFLHSPQIPGGALLFAHLGVSETLVLGQVGVCPPGTTGTPPNCKPITQDGPPPPGPRGEPPGPFLPVTGFGGLGLLALCLILGTAGAGLLSWDRRRPVTA